MRQVPWSSEVSGASGTGITMVVSHHWVLGTKPVSFTRVASALTTLSHLSSPTEDSVYETLPLTVGEAFWRAQELLQLSKSHLEPLLCCEHCIPGSKTTGEGEREWASLKTYSEVFLRCHRRFPAYSLIKAHFLKSLRQSSISAVFTICLVLCICVWTNVYLYFRVFPNRAVLGHSTLSRQPSSFAGFRLLLGRHCWGQH